MLARQREFRLGVIEPGGVLPLRFLVTVLALRPQAALVLVVLAVTAVAGFRRSAIFLARDVATRAFRVGVLAGERETGLRVVEAPLGNRRDVHVAPFMVGVTGAARLRREPAMKAVLLAEITGDLLVTVEAELVLRQLVELDVALFALLLDFRVPCDDFPGHEDAFQRLRAGRHRQPSRCHANKESPSPETHFDSSSVHVDGDDVGDGR